MRSTSMGWAAPWLERGLALTMALTMTLALAAAGAARASTVERTPVGVIVRPDAGAVREVRLEVMRENIIHVVKLDQAGKQLTPSLMTVATPCACAFTLTRAARGPHGATLTLRAGKIAVTVALADGQLSFADAHGAVFLRQAAESLTPALAGAQPFLAITEGFNHGTADAYYGLGQHQNGQMNLNGEDVLLAQHNMDVAIPFVVSDKNYGVLWDNNGISRFGDSTPYGPLARDLALTDADGQSGALTARYYVGGKLRLTRREPDIAYQYLKDVAEHWPKELGALATLKDVKVTWDATLVSNKPGVHKLQLYASDYATLQIDGKTVLDVWRQGWNPWYHNFDINFAAGKPVKLHLDWRPTGGMVAITHNNPLPAAQRHSLTLSSELAEAINYYVVSAASIDGVIAGYRQLTGPAVLMPKWAYGFWQSRQRYETADQLLGVLREYRQRGWPLDNIVQDWFYWPENGWGSHDFDPARFPDPKAMVDEVHRAHAHLMLSIWGKFYASTANYQELAAAGHMWTANVANGDLDWVGPGYKNSHYDPYTPEARAIYYRQLKHKLVDLGVDAWWMDNSEPDILSNTRPADFKKLIGPTIYGAGELTYNAYSLLHTQAMSEGLARDQPERRQFILSRSGFAGIQRNGVAVWSGDTASRWSDLHDQIAAGVGFSMSGIPNWTHDIGGYAQETRYQGGDVGAAQENRSTASAAIAPADAREWLELNVRWFEFGAFSPLFRSHGEVLKREIYNLAPADSPARAAMVGHDRLRYRLMPYIYTAAADTYHRDGSIMRGLVMDFPHDARARGINDEYLFGRDLLIAPVSEDGARARPVYLPRGAAWYDFHTGARYAGGSTVTLAAPLERIPVLVKAGAIVPLGPVTQYVDEHPDAALTFNVYTGADGTASLYEDDGVSKGYLRGQFSRIALRYDDKTGRLHIAARVGQYPGMVATRAFRIRFIKPGMASVDDGDTAAGRIVRYDGHALTVSRSAPTAGR